MADGTSERFSEGNVDGNSDGTSDGRSVTGKINILVGAVERTALCAFDGESDCTLQEKSELFLEGANVGIVDSKPVGKSVVV